MIENFLKLKSALNRSSGYSFLFALCSFLPFFFIANYFPAQRVGDGSEYYGLFYSWVSDLRPWMSNRSFELYNNLFVSHDVLGMVATDQLKDAFPALRVGDTHDFNHFWLYSFLAYAISNISSVIFNADVHQSFLLLHAFLFLIPLYFAFSLFRWKGVLVVVAIIISSPIIWYINKIHTEWFTFCLTIAAVIAFSGKRYLASSLMLAIASTQNISFALIAFFPFMVGLFYNLKKGYQLKDLVAVVLISLVTLLHPTYYFFRYGVLTPQFLAGGATSSPNIFDSYIWLFDFDVGLMPNWILGSLVLIFFIIKKRAMLRNITRESVIYLLFLVVFLFVNLYAHASTTNINSGATPGLSRYALWYIPLLFTPFLTVISSIVNTMGNVGTKLWFGCVLCLTSLAIFINVKLYNPGTISDYSKPSNVSNWVQTHFPRYYNPPVEIYFERYSGYGERWDLASKLRAMIGPDCQKALVFTSHFNKEVNSPAHCLYNPAKLKIFFNDASKLQTGANVLKVNQGLLSKFSSEYIYINNEIMSSFLRTFREGTHQIGIGNKLDYSFLGRGWGGVEQSGVWSVSDNMKILIPCKEADGSSVINAKLKFNLGEFVPQNVIVTADEKTLAVANENDKKEFDLDLPQCVGNHWTINLNVSSPTAPSEISDSGDNRKLAIWLTSIELKRGLD